MINNNPNFGTLNSVFTTLKLVITNQKLTVPNNPYITATYTTNGAVLKIYALQNIAIAFSLNCFNSNYTPTIMGLQVNPIYISQTDTSFSTQGDACDITLFRPLEQGYGLQIDLNNTGDFNIYLIIAV